MKRLILVSISLFLIACQMQTPEKAKSNQNIEELDSSEVVFAQIDSISQLITKDSLNAALYFERAGMQMKVEDLQSGLSDLHAAVKLDSMNATYWLKLGVVNYAMEASRNAKNCWERCANLDSKNIDCRLNLAEVYLAVGELKKGERRLKEVLEYDDKNSSALFLAGNYALMNLDTVKAIKYLQSAINVDQTLFRAYDQLGVLYASKQNLLALDYYNAALKLRPYHYELHYKVGMFYQSIQAYDEAIRAYYRVLEGNAEHKMALHNIAVIAVFAKDYDRAVEYFGKAIAADASYLEAYFGRAYTYELLGDLIKSESDYRTSLMLDPAYLPAIDGLERLEKK